MNLNATRHPTPPLPPPFYERLIDFYHRQPSVEPHLSPLWKMLQGFHGPLIQALNGRDPAVLADVLGHLYERKVMYGLDSSAESLDVMDLGMGTERYLTPDYYVDASIRLLRMVAANCGPIPAPNPEQGDTYEPTVEEMVVAVEQTIGCPLTHPGGGGVSGLVVGDRYIPHKLIDAAGVVATMKRLSDVPAMAVLEIGAGAGWVGYLIHRCLKLPYFTIDLPVVAVMQAYMLAAATSPDLVWLWGEEGSGTEPFCIYGLEYPRWGGFLAFNQNSFPEIAEREQERLVWYLEKALNPGGVFLSVNHESSLNQQRRVYVPLSASKHFRLVHRSPWWQRPGWIEEEWRRV